MVRGAAWTLPVIAASAAAPAFGASPCVNKTALLPVTWSATGTTTTQTGTTTNGTTVNVVASYTATALGSGSISTSNLATQNVVTTRDSFSVVNNSPTTLALDPSANYQTVTFRFTKPVFGLTFTIDDIDRGSGYWDAVGLAADPAETPAPTYGSPTTITGGGTIQNPWQTNATTGGDNLASQRVKVTYANGLTGISVLTLRFWSTVLPVTSAVHLLRVGQMSFRTCA